MEWGRAGYVQYKKGRWSGEERVRSSTKKQDGVGKSGLGPVQKTLTNSSVTGRRRATTGG
jgi:hypothetical protein